MSNYLILSNDMAHTEAEKKAVSQEEQSKSAMGKREYPVR